MDNFINNVELEKQLISAILTNQNALYNVNNLLNEDCITDHFNKKVWKAIISLHNSGEPIDVGSVFNYLHNRDSNFKVSDLIDLQTNFFTTDVTHVGKVLYEKYVRREAILYASNLISKCQDQTNDVYELINDNKERMIKILSPADTKINSLDNTILKNINYIHENLGKYCEVRGIPSGFEEFDKRLGGAGKGWLVVIGGRPAMGKTTFTINWAYNSYKLFNKSVMFFTGEMSAEEIGHLIMARESSVSALDLKKNKINHKDLESLKNKFSNQNGNTFLIDATPNPSLTHILAEATKAKMQHDIDIVFVDHMHIVKAAGEKRNLEVAKISRELKGLARNLNIPVIALAQLNRGVEGRTIKTPQLSDLKESGDIEQDADVVTFLHRPEYYMDEKDKKDQFKEGITHLVTRKHRHGEIGIDYLLMNKSTSAFESYIMEQDTSIAPEQYNKKLTELVEYEEFTEPKIVEPKVQTFTDKIKKSEQINIWQNTELSFRDKIDESDLPF